MARIYGSKWMQFGESDDGTWLDGLAGISPQQVVHGLNTLVAECYEWPPALPEFKKLCLDINDDDMVCFIESVALYGLDSFSRNQLSIYDRKKLIENARPRAMREYIKYRIENNSNDLLRLSNGN